MTPGRLPPTAAAAQEHCLRAHLQYHDWMLLESQLLAPIDYGWRRGDSGFFEPIPSVELIAQMLSLSLPVVTAKWTLSLHGQQITAAAKKIAFKRVPACEKCHGLSCENAWEM